MTLSGAVLVKNEKNTLEKCLTSLSFCDEIVVIDDFSTDSTIPKIKKLHDDKIRILQKKLISFSDQRNWAIEKTSGDWILFIDSDEIVSRDLRDEILRVIALEDFDAFKIKREDILWGERIKKGELSSMYLLRLARKTFGSWEGSVHEVWRGRGKVGKIKEPIIHYPYVSIAEFLGKLDMYTNLRRDELSNLKTHSNVFTILAYPIGKFIVTYFLKRGFLDGNRGFVLSVMMSFHSFLVRSKVYHGNKKR